jgi:hypothetical protein
MDNPFSWDYLTTVPGPNEVFGPFAVVFLILFGGGFLVSLIISNDWATQWFKDPVLHRMAKRWSGFGLVLFTLGLFFFLVRWLQINPFDLGMRLWLWLCLVALVALIVYILWDYRANYPAARAAYDDQVKQRLYMQSSSDPRKLQAYAREIKGQHTPRPRPTRRKRL